MSKTNTSDGALASETAGSGTKSHLASLPPLTTTSPSVRSIIPPSLSKESKDKSSQQSPGSEQPTSLPQSQAVGNSEFPQYPSSLSYTSVRDFAYPISNPLHYGPPPEPSQPPSGMTTPTNNMGFSGYNDSMPSWQPFRGGEPPHMILRDGPPYREDDDLQSPIVATRLSRHRSSQMGRNRGQNTLDGDDRNSYQADGHERYVGGSDADGAGGESSSYPLGQAHRSRDFHFSQHPDDDDDDHPENFGLDDSGEVANFRETNRYSRDYQFTITSPDEEFHGKAVALFDFERENENELPLIEGQIIWVSYRHGQGWLVAEDPKTRESGLVPEEYVRLLRDIEGGMHSLTGSADPSADTDGDGQAEISLSPATYSAGSANGYHQPVLSTFSTSSKDLNPYPTEQLGIQAGQVPPQVVHYHGQHGGSGSSQNSTPTMTKHEDEEKKKQGGA